MLYADVEQYYLVSAAKSAPQDVRSVLMRMERSVAFALNPGTWRIEHLAGRRPRSLQPYLSGDPLLAVAPLAWVGVCCEHQLLRHGNSMHPSVCANDLA